MTSIEQVREIPIEYRKRWLLLQLETRYNLADHLAGTRRGRTSVKARAAKRASACVRAYRLLFNYWYPLP